MSQQHSPDEYKQHMQGQQIIEIHEQDSNQQFSQDYKQEIEQEIIVNNEQQQDIKDISKIQKIANPISPYTQFIKYWKINHQEQKVNLKLMGNIWKNLQYLEKQKYVKLFLQQKIKYEEYISSMIISDPNFIAKNKIGKTGYLFPLHRIKSIMKQDKSYTPTTQNITTMCKTVQYFGQYLLQQIKKSTQGKKKIDISDLYQVINNNQNTLWFLNCIIDQRNLQNQTPHKNTQHKKTKSNNNIDNIIVQQPAIKKKQNIQKHHIRKIKQQIPKGQLKLTDMF